MVLDVLDREKVWYEGNVVHNGTGDVLIHFTHWPSKYDERISKDSDRLAPHGSHICNAMPVQCNQ